MHRPTIHWHVRFHNRNLHCLPFYLCDLPCYSTKMAIVLCCLPRNRRANGDPSSSSSSSSSSSNSSRKPRGEFCQRSPRLEAVALVSQRLPQQLPQRLPQRLPQTVQRRGLPQTMTYETAPKKPVALFHWTIHASLMHCKRCLTNPSPRPRLLLASAASKQTA